MASRTNELDTLPASGAASAQFVIPGPLQGLAMLLCLGLFMGLALWGLKPPRTIPATAPATEFSSERAMTHVTAIAQKPHPVGSDAHESARSYIVNALAAQGLTAEVQSETERRIERPPAYFYVDLHNIMARLKGQEEGKAVLLSAHYDSVPNGIGASDDASGVATLLETLRALKAGPGLKNDVIFLFTDGEEISLVGARVFLEHPWAQDVAVGLNFESRGTGGPVFMYETSNLNAWPVQKLAQTAQYPIASSYMADVYRTMPNDTDLSLFMRDSEMAGLNFAYIGNGSFFHTAADNIQNLDERSLQHSGAYALALTREIGNVDLNTVPRAHFDRRPPSQIVYFDLLGLTLVHYPSALILPLTIFAALLLAGVIIIGVKRRQVTPGGVILGFVSILSSTIAAALIAKLIGELIRRLAPSPDAGAGFLTLAGVLLMTSAAVLAIYTLFSRKASVLSLSVGSLIGWLVLAIVTTFFLRGASYLFVWPLIFGLIPLGLLFSSGGRSLESPTFAALFALCAAPGVIFVATTIYALHMGVGLTFPEAFAVLVALLGGLLIPHLSLMKAMVKNRTAFASGAAVLAAILLVAGVSIRAGASASHPKTDSLFYGLNADTGKAVWASTDKATDRWTSQFITGSEKGDLSEYFPLTMTALLTSPAPPASLPPPDVTLLASNETNGVRTLRLRISSSRGAHMLDLATDETAEVIAASLNGERTNSHKNRIMLRYYAFPRKGIELSIEVKSAKPLAIRVADYTFGLAESTSLSIPQRPPDLMPDPTETWMRENWLQDSVAVSKTYVF